LTDRLPIISRGRRCCLITGNYRNNLSGGIWFRRYRCHIACDYHALKPMTIHRDMLLTCITFWRVTFSQCLATLFVCSFQIQIQRLQWIHVSRTVTAS